MPNNERGTWRRGGQNDLLHDCSYCLIQYYWGEGEAKKPEAMPAVAYIAHLMNWIQGIE